MTALLQRWHETRCRWFGHRWRVQHILTATGTRALSVTCLRCGKTSGIVAPKPGRSLSNYLLMLEVNGTIVEHVKLGSTSPTTG